MSAAAESIHTLADLAAWSFPGPALAVIGRPVAHSLSPAIHNAALADLARAQSHFADWRYFKFDIAPEELPPIDVVLISHNSLTSPMVK